MSEEYLQHNCSSYYTKPATPHPPYTYRYYPTSPGKATPELFPKKKYSSVEEQFKSPYCPY